MPFGTDLVSQRIDAGPFVEIVVAGVCATPSTSTSNLLLVDVVPAIQPIGQMTPLTTCGVVCCLGDVIETV